MSSLNDDQPRHNKKKRLSKEHYTKDAVLAKKRKVFQNAKVIQKFRKVRQQETKRQKQETQKHKCLRDRVLVPAGTDAPWQRAAEPVPCPLQPLHKVSCSNYHSFIERRRRTSTCSSCVCDRCGATACTIKAIKAIAIHYCAR